MKSLFNLIAFQETWFDETVDDHELTKNTNYNLFRQDRRETSHIKQGGGGVALLIQSEIRVKRHFFDNIRILQYICVEVTIGSSILLVVNIYSPFGFVGESNIELGVLLRGVEALHKTDIILLGDFNMPSLKWRADIELPGVFIPFGNESTELFINTFFDHNLMQILEPPTSRNHLDLAFVGDINSFHCTYPIAEELLDRVSTRHSPFVANYQIVTEIVEKITYLNFGRTNLRKSKKDIAGSAFVLATEEEAMMEQWSDNTHATSKIVGNMERIKDIVVRNTPVKKVGRSWVSKHPWLKNSKDYERSNSLKIVAKKNYQDDPSELNKQIYGRACSFNSEIYNRERELFMLKSIDETKGNTYEFYALMKSGTRVRRETPESMLYEGVYSRVMRN